ncbi:MAG: hypothetical protein CML16_15470 [Pusillimonas sp.]|nr:hypothetical protein [Pusillimonas sp.]HCP76669.1 hypothetical protein [Pusillimonas sp.]|tara:strand:- start:116 stop:412 length:297 start_codon:yes stop_codon:yes gene_type:complete
MNDLQQNSSPDNDPVQPDQDVQTPILIGKRRAATARQKLSNCNVWNLGVLEGELASIKGLRRVSTETVDNFVQNYGQRVVLRGLAVQWSIISHFVEIN